MEWTLSNDRFSDLATRAMARTRNVGAIKEKRGGHIVPPLFSFIV
jgi:hypothetical protein